MTTTKRIPHEQLGALFDRFTKQHLRDEHEETVSIEVLSSDMGDQQAVRDARLLGITWEAKRDVLEVFLEGDDHMVFAPKEVWVIEEDDGFLSVIELVHDDDTREILQVRRPAPITRLEASP